MSARTVGVVGAGVIGEGVTQALVTTGHEVVLIDLSEQILEGAMRRLRTALRLHRLSAGSRTSCRTEDAVRRVTCSVDLAALADVDFVIENATEKWAVKAPLYRKLDHVCRRECIFAANTSAISIDRLAAVTNRPSHVIGMHFMNPVPLTPTVEMIRGRATSPETIEAATALLVAMGKNELLVNDSPGFVSNRVLMLTINEAIAVVDEGVAAIPDVDRLFRECFGHKMGPLETADLIGLDTVVLSLDVLFEAFADPKFQPCPLLRRMVQGGRLGRKSGEGFYPYADTGRFEAGESA
jgi:3-hydroxybutyryl-CoA dehydrogenase